MKLVAKHSHHQQHALLLAFFSLTLLTCLFQTKNSYAQEATITDFTASNSENQLLIYLTVKDSFSEEMETAIHNGIPATFTFYVNLFEKKKNWPDKKIVEHEFNHSIEYDSLKKEYLIQRKEKGNSRLTSSLEEAKALMSEVNGLIVLPLDELEPQVSYSIRVKAELTRKTLPLYFHYLIPFSSPWNFETDWHELGLHLAL